MPSDGCPGNKADRPVAGFSGGERQRLGIAQSLVNSPGLARLDEPTASLDPMGRHDVLEIMERLRGTTTIFYSTHILEDVQRVSDNVAILNNGQLVAQAPIEQLLRRGEHVAYSVLAQGNEQAIRQLPTTQAWVSSVVSTPVNGLVRYDVAVSDESAADDRLLKLLTDGSDVKVKEFGQKKHSLQDIFVQIMKEENHAK